jgi:hypothetical protein
MFSRRDVSLIKPEIASQGSDKQPTSRNHDREISASKASPGESNKDEDELAA